MALGPTLDLGNLLVHLKADSSQYDRVMKRVTAGIKSTAKRVMQASAAISAASVYAFARFDQAMTRSLAIMKGVSPTMRKQMEEVAIAISKKGITSAKNLAESYYFLASAGMTASQSVAALGAVEKFAVAGAFDMATATTLAVDAQSALGLRAAGAQKNLKNLKRVMDVLIGANTLANATTEQFSKSLTTQAGAALKAYNIELEEGVSILATYAEQGIKAERAGTMLSRMLRLATKGAIDNASAWERMGVEMFDDIGNFRAWADIIKDLERALGDLAPRAKALALEQLGFQARSQQTIMPLLGASDKLRRFNDELKRMQGITEAVAEEQMKSFANQMINLKNTIVAIGIEIGRQLAPSLLALRQAFLNNQEEIAHFVTTAAKYLNFGIQVFASFINYMLNDFTGAFRMAMQALTVITRTAMETVYLLIKKGIARIGRDIGKWIKEIPSIIKAALETMPKDPTQATYKIYRDMGGKIGQNIQDGILRETIQLPTAPTERGAGRMIALHGPTLQKIQVEAEKWQAAQIKLYEQTQMVGPPRPDNVIADMWANAKKQIDEIIEAQGAGSEAAQKFLGQWLKLEKELNKQLKSRKGTVHDINRAIVFAESWLGEGLPVTEFDKVQEEENPWQKRYEDFMSSLTEWGDQASAVWKNIGSAAARAMDRATDSIVQMVMTGEASFSGFAKAVMADLASIVIRANIARAAMALFPSLFSGLGADVPHAGEQTNPRPVAHTGGIVGRSLGGGRRRMIPNSVFIGAPRLHTGLRPGEFPAILQRGEAVIPRGGTGPGTGAGVPPTVVINNNTGKEMRQEGPATFNGREWVVGVVVEDLNTHGPISQMMEGMTK